MGATLGTAMDDQVGDEAGDEAGAEDGDEAGDEKTGHNRVVLRGRVSGAPDQRELPSGALVVGVRVAVPRDGAATAMTKGSKQTVDWVECAAWSGLSRRTVARWEVGDLVEVEGALRRRFPRGGGLSRIEVEVLRARRLSRG